MEYIGDKCPYCGKEIEVKVGEIPSKVTKKRQKNEFEKYKNYNYMKGN